jgi:soluble lytic murein transglycosylase
MSLVRPYLRFLWAMGLVAVGCERADARVRPNPSRPAPASASARPALAPKAAASPQGAEPWVEALRAGRYAEAARSLDALGAALSKRPELVFARARAAEELDDFRRAADLTRGLEARLPGLEGRIRRLRAEAELESGPHASAAEYFLARSDPESLARAALALERSGDTERARAVATRVISELAGKRQRDVESQARDVRARVAAGRGQTSQAAIDLRWIALENPLWSKDADTRLAELAKDRALTKEERLARMLAFAKAGAVARVEREIGALPTSPGTALGTARVDRARAFALYYSRSDYAKAAELFTRAARGPGVDPAECAFYAARSFARGQDDEKALSGYRDLHARFSRTSWAEQALYLVARTNYSSGRFADAARGYDAYLRAHGSRGRFRRDALYERAVSWLANKSFVPAAQAFSELARIENDDRRAARLRHLEGVARAGAGENARAVELFSRVLREQPLGFSALASSTRLERLGHARPPLFPNGSAPLESLGPLAVELPESVALLRSVGLDADAEVELGRHEAGLVKRHAPRSYEALCATYALLDTGARRYQIAQDRVDGRVLVVAPSSGTRWQWDCVYPRPYGRLVGETAKAFGLPEALLYGVMRQESGFRPGVSSPAGANGLMQVIVPTAERVARELGEPFDTSLLDDPGPNLRLGGHYLKKLLQTFGGNVPLAAGAYNAGPVAMRRWMDGASGLSVDVFVARIPYAETLDYVERVVGNYARYRYLEGGESAVPRLELELPKAPPASADLY